MKLWHQIRAALAAFRIGGEATFTFKPAPALAAGLLFWLGAGSAGASQVYPVLDPALAYAHERHAGESRFGSVGTLNAEPNSSQVVLAPVWQSSTGALRFTWHFGSTVNLEEFAGFFLTFGRIAVDTVQTDGTPGARLDLHGDGTVNLNHLSTNAPAPVSIEAVRLVIRRLGSGSNVTAKVELQDAHANKSAVRFIFVPTNPQPVTVTIPLSLFSGGFDRTALKQLAVVIERNHYGDNVHNALDGGFDLLQVALVDQDGPSLDAGALAALPPTNFVRELARRDFETLWRLGDAKTGACLDRTLFRDLIHWGATGWLLAGLPGAVAENWVTLAEAEDRALKILRFADNDALWGDDPTGKLGNSRGQMYRFGGIDPYALDGPLTGTRKLDLGDINAVEASTIDTALFQCGAAACAGAFTNATANQIEIRTRVTSLLRRTRWNELVDPATGQFRMAWKPQRDDTPPGYFTAPAPFGGYWASRDTNADNPLTIDYWTSEGALAALLATGAATNAVGPEYWYGMTRLGVTGAVGRVTVSWPGSWFTYAFLPALLLDPGLGADRGLEYGVPAVDWPLNAVRAFGGFQALSPPGTVVLPDAVELPDITYIAQGLPPLAADPAPVFKGVITPYSLQMAIGLGGPTAAAAITELKRLLTTRPELWDPLVGLLDSTHPDLATFQTTSNLLRQTGAWVQQQKWPLNAGAALLAELNYLQNGAVWRPAASHNVLSNAVDRIYRQPRPAGQQLLRFGPLNSDFTPGIAMNGSLLLVADGYVESLSFYNLQGFFIGGVDNTAIGQALAAAGVTVERSPGPPGLRDVAALPDGDFAALVADANTSVLLRVGPDGSVSVLATNLGAPSGYPRISVGGSPPVILVTTASPVHGAAVVALDGTLLRRLGPGGSDNYSGVATAPGGNALYLLKYSDGTILRYSDLTSTNGVWTTVGQLPTGAEGGDLAYDTGGSGLEAGLLALGLNGQAYHVALGTGAVTAADFGTAAWDALDTFGSMVAFVERVPYHDFGQVFQRTLGRVPLWLHGVHKEAAEPLRFLVVGNNGATATIETSTNLLQWAPLWVVPTSQAGGAFEDVTGTNGVHFYRGRYND